MQLFNWPSHSSLCKLPTWSDTPQILSTSLQVHFPGKEWICQASSVLEINLGTLRSSGHELMFESGVSTQQGYRRGVCFPPRSSISLPLPFLMGSGFVSVHVSLLPYSSPLFQFRLHLSLARFFCLFYIPSLRYLIFHVLMKLKLFLSFQNLVCH